VLGIDRRGVAYLASSWTDPARPQYNTPWATTHSEVVALDLNTMTLRARFAMPSQVLSLARAGNRLVAATAGSVHLLQPVCGDALPEPPRLWPTLDCPEPQAGCPDADADGVRDYFDQCPNESEDGFIVPSRVDGCPSWLAPTPP
jgi:hypothetical protein